MPLTRAADATVEARSTDRAPAAVRRPGRRAFDKTLNVFAESPIGTAPYPRRVPSERDVSQGRAHGGPARGLAAPYRTRRESIAQHEPLASLGGQLAATSGFPVKGSGPSSPSLARPPRSMPCKGFILPAHPPPQREPEKTVSPPICSLNA